MTAKHVQVVTEVDFILILGAAVIFIVSLVRFMNIVVFVTIGIVQGVAVISDVWGVTALAM